MLSKLSMVILLLLLIGCSKSVLDYNKLEAFDDLHASVARYSASIDSRAVSWDSLGIEYRTKISEDMSEKEYFDLIGELLRAFRDPHVWLLTPSDSMYTIDFLGYVKNYEESLVKTYLSDIETHNTSIHSAFINDSVGYLFCADFKGDEELNNQIYTNVLHKFSDTKGLVIDLRINDGGSVYNAQNLLNKFSADRVLWHTTQNRTTDGFDEKFEWFIEPDLAVLYSNPVVVLNGRFTISAGERFAMGAQLLDHMTILGDTTANTQGSVLGREMLNGWKYTLTFEKVLNPDGVNFGGIGIPPDEHIPFDPSTPNAKDYLLEKALEILN